MKVLVDLLATINDSWSLIIVAIGLCIILYRKIKSYLKLSTQQKIDAALSELEQVILKFTANAEIDWSAFNKAGQVKRAEVISQIYREYPVLKKAVSQEDLIKFIDNLIDDSLDEVKKVTASVAEDAVTQAVEAIEDLQDKAKEVKETKETK